jgi:hypothetical protein
MQTKTMISVAACRKSRSSEVIALKVTVDFRHGRILATVVKWIKQFVCVALTRLSAELLELGNVGLVLPMVTVWGNFGICVCACDWSTPPSIAIPCYLVHNMNDGLFPRMPRSGCGVSSLRFVPTAMSVHFVNRCTPARIQLIALPVVGGSRVWSTCGAVFFHRVTFAT